MSFIEIAGPTDTAETKYKINNIYNIRKKTCAINCHYVFSETQLILMEASSGHISLWVLGASEKKTIFFGHPFMAGNSLL